MKIEALDAYKIIQNTPSIFPTTDRICFSKNNLGNEIFASYTMGYPIDHEPGLDGEIRHKHINWTLLSSFSDKKEQQLKIQVYPNPFTEHITIDIPPIEQQYKHTLVLSDVSGRIVWQETNNQVDAIRSNLKAISNNLNPGFYFLHYSNTKTTEVKSFKIVKR